MPLKTKFNKVLDTTVAANTNDTFVSPVIPIGKTAVITRFRGSVPDTISYTALQWGAGSTWETVDVSYGNFNFVYSDKGMVFVGNGVKQFRIVRANKSLTLVQLLFAGVDGYINDA
jgi:hypothetical protein